MTKATDIVGYTYNAEQWTPAGLIAQYVNEGGLATMRKAQSPEEVLDMLAAYEGIDRQDERSYDSDDFPKVIFSSDVDEDELFRNENGEYVKL